MRTLKRNAADRTTFVFNSPYGGISVAGLPGSRRTS
ncbi:hypothetical protein AWB64_04925 [Caballeronia sordidicola]|uniref:Uncharacterized protein n=1 Tax=Caballeronia sordidicola TaxID=196367 RepID=A0A158HQP1_CABSO|nr:hypothetical protein AWB64_04925 [Caballeronia sordidicola]